MKNVALIILFQIVFFGCDIFETRTPEEPDTGRTTFITPTTPDQLFENMTKAFEEKVLENYMACFVDPAFSDKGFVFVPTAGAISAYSTLASWDLQSERSYFNNLRTLPGEGNPIILTLSEIADPIRTGDSAVYQFNYRILLQLEDDRNSEEFRGSLLFRIYRDSRQQWCIGEWQDNNINDYLSWSDLKGRYY